jgi:hypothetical protein
MADELHKPTQNTTKKPLAAALSAVALTWRDGGGDLTNAQYKPIWHCHNETPLCNEYILIKSKNITSFAIYILASVHVFLISEVCIYVLFEITNFLYPINFVLS